VSTAAVTQVDIAKDRTEVFVAEVAQDVVEERFEVPMFIDTFVDFHHLSDWGREVIAEKVAEVSELQSTLAPSVESSDTTPKTSSSSQDTSSDKPSVVEESNKSQESEKKQSTNKENQTSNKTDDEEKAKSEKSQSTQEEKTVNEQESQETETSSNDESQESDVNNELPIIETPFDAEDISIRQVSPSL
jgi:cobalamin biosynthesis protein CobT